MPGPFWATEDVDIGGQRIRAGSKVTLVIGAANRDPTKFSCPDGFDIARRESPNLSFSTGRHVCIGKLQARLSAAAVLPPLLALPGLRLGPGPLIWKKSPVHRGFEGLPIEWDRKAAA